MHITPTTADLRDLIIADSPDLIMNYGTNETIVDPYHKVLSSVKLFYINSKMHHTKGIGHITIGVILWVWRIN